MSIQKLSDMEQIPLYLQVMDICDNLSQAVILSRIVFWHRPNQDGKSRLSVEQDNQLWIAKSVEAWGEECKLPKSTARDAINALEASGLIIKSSYSFKKKKTLHVRLIEDKLLNVIQNNIKIKDLIQAGKERNSSHANAKESTKSAQAKDEKSTKSAQAKDEIRIMQDTKSVLSPIVDSIYIDSTITRKQTCKQHVYNNNARARESSPLSPFGETSNILKFEAQKNKKPSAKKNAEKKNIESVDVLNSKEAIMKAVAHSFQTAESYSGYNGILRSQLLGTAKKGVRKEFAFEKPATAIEIVGFKYWFESTFNGLTPKNLKAETLYEKFMQMRDDARYQNALFKGEQVLRDEILHLEKQVESASDEPINLEKSRAVLAAIHANFAQAQAARREQIQAALEAKAQHRARVIQQRNEIIKKLEEEALIEQQQNEFFAKIEAGEIQ